MNYMFMNESVLHKCSVFVTIFGFLILLLVFFFAQPKDVVGDQIPQDREIRVVGEITALRPSASGTIIEFTRVCSDSGFISASIPDELKGSSVSIIGKLSGDFFSISSVEFIDR
jgi:hypothetical protein